MSMYPGDEPYTSEQDFFERAERAAEEEDNAQVAMLARALPVLRRMLVPGALVVWEDIFGETVLVIVAADKPRIEVRYEGGVYVAQAYDHASILHDMVDADPAALALTIKTWLAHAQMGEFLSAAAADFYNRR